MVAGAIHQRTARIRRELDIIDAEMGATLESVKAQLGAFVASAEALGRQCDEMEKLTQDIRAKRSSLVNPPQ
jgi:hypothetical protein